MIYIEKNILNQIPLTLAEKSNTATPFYLFVFSPEWGTDLEDIYFTSPDVSSYPSRINIFELKEGDNGSETSANGFNSLGVGESHLKLKRGQYIYKVYESEIETLDVTETTLNIVETGRMVVGLEIDETTELNINDNIYL
jgi:hypothetical protein